MSIMMKVFKDGKLYGQCDKKCYNSKSKTCTCVCQGLLHGKGRNNAVHFLRKTKTYYRWQYRSGDGFRVDFF